MISLDMVECVERRYGSIYALAENLSRKSLPPAIVKDILNYIGYEAEEDESAEELLADILLDIIEPAELIGAVELGELLAA